MGRALVTVLTAGALAIPLLFDTYVVHLADVLAIQSILAVGLDLVVGHSGQISLGHAAFAGIAGYTSAILTVGLRIPFWLSAVPGILLAGAAGWLLSFPALRLRGYSLALATLAFGEIIEVAIRQWKALTGGSDGLAIPAPRLGPLALGSPQRTFYLIWPVAALAFLLASNVLRSRVGRAFAGARESELGAQAVGIDVIRYRRHAFVLGALYAGVAGTLHSALTQYLHPDDFGFSRSILYLTMVIVGGAGRTFGPLTGAAVLTIAPELLRPFMEFQELILGGLLLASITLLPGGLAGFAWKPGRRPAAR